MSGVYSHIADEWRKDLVNAPTSLPGSDTKPPGPPDLPSL